MSTMEILEAMTNIDDGFIENAMPKPRKDGRTVTRIILLAALITVLAMTAVAAKEITNWFEAYFAKFSEEPLTQNQIDFIDENTTNLTQSQTCLGYTLAVESAISDGNYGYIKLKFTAPEFVVLDADFYHPGNLEYLTTEEMEIDDSTGMGFGFALVEDNDDLPNTVSLMVTIDGCVRDRTEWNLYITKIVAIYHENPGTEEFREREETVALGPWEFDITFSEAGKEELELITEPIPGQVDVSIDTPFYKDVYIISLKLRAMSAEIAYEYLEPDIVNGEPIIPVGDFGYVYVVMKDGSQVWMRGSSYYPGGCTFEFTPPIVLDEVSYVLFPDGTKIPVN